MAPLFIGDAKAPGSVRDGLFPWHQDRRTTLVEASTIEDMVLLRYALSPRFRNRAGRWHVWCPDSGDPARCLKTCRTDVSGDPGLSRREPPACGYDS